MFGPFSTRRGVVLYLLAWLMLGLVMGGLLAGSTGIAWSSAFLFVVPLVLVYAFAAGFSALYLCRAFPLARNEPARVFLVVGFGGAVAAACWLAGAVGWNGLLVSFNTGVVLTAGLKAMLLGLGVVLYGLCAVGHYLAIESERNRLAERRELELKLMAQEAELRMLRTQIDPHFLFNSLNSISALTSIDAGRARDMTLRLSEFFRHSLGLDAQRKVTLEDEVKLVEHFLAIEKVRFGARLAVEFEIAEDARTCLLPPMILQPLVENAVKHGIGGMPDGGLVVIRAQRSGSLLKVAVENGVDEDSVARKGKGIGLPNVRQRLATSYGYEAGISWNRVGDKFVVEMNIPAETGEQR
jgi:two-component sensor histidine kinase